MLGLYFSPGMFRFLGDPDFEIFSSLMCPPGVYGGLHYQKSLTDLFLSKLEIDTAIRQSGNLLTW